MIHGQGAHEDAENTPLTDKCAINKIQTRNCTSSRSSLLEKYEQLLKAHVKVDVGSHLYDDMMQESYLVFFSTIDEYDILSDVPFAAVLVANLKRRLTSYYYTYSTIVPAITTVGKFKAYKYLLENKELQRSLCKKNISKIAKQAGSSNQDILTAHQYLSSSNPTFNSVSDRENEGFYDLIYIECDSDNIHKDTITALINSRDFEYLNKRVCQAITGLSSREATIIKKRWLLEKRLKLKELAYRFEISAERVRTIEKSSLEKLRRSISLEATAA